jgi:hypothetical protein
MSTSTSVLLVLLLPHVCLDRKRRATVHACACRYTTSCLGKVVLAGVLCLSFTDSRARSASAGLFCLHGTISGCIEVFLAARRTAALSSAEKIALEAESHGPATTEERAIDAAEKRSAAVAVDANHRNALLLGHGPHLVMARERVLSMACRTMPYPNDPRSERGP